MYHQLQPAGNPSTSQLYHIPYDRNLYLTVTSPEPSPCSLSSKEISEITFSHQHFLITPARQTDSLSCKESDSLIIKKKLEKESTESDEQKSSSSADQPKSTSSEPRLGVRQLQLYRNERNDYFNVDSKCNGQLKLSTCLSIISKHCQL